MKNKYLLYLGVMGTLTPLSILLWAWRVVNVESLNLLVPQPTKLVTFVGLILLSSVFAGLTIYFMFKSRQQCISCGHDLERQIIQAEKLATVGQLAGGVAHEVNTPASIISGRIETMLMEPQRLSKQDQEDLLVIKKQAERISQIARGLLLFAKRSPAKKNRVDVNDLILEAVTLIESQLKKSKIEVKKNLFPEPLFVWAQPNQMVQVLLNLLANARDAMPSGGSIEISSQLKSGKREFAQIRLTDTGTGIPEENIHKIFDPFFTTKPAGTGLGLSVSYGIIQEHGGTISVASTLSQGTTFTILLPSAKKPALATVEV